VENADVTMAEREKIEACPFFTDGWKKMGYSKVTVR
jgi:hypothetical protein